MLLQATESAPNGPTRMHYKVLRRTRVGMYAVSTVWLGLDHGFSLKGTHAPLIFETMVFEAEYFDDKASSSGHDFDVDRYSTEGQAFAGHEQMVTVVRATTGSDTIEELWPE